MAPEDTTGGGSGSDAEARDAIRFELDESLIVEAAAGTGKTTELVNRLVALIASGKATVDRIVAVTFTRKAAGELKLRLRQELDRARQAEAAGSRRIALERAIAHLEEARIGTIHAFCAELLRERPVEAEVDPDFVDLDEDEAPRFFDRAFQSWIQERLENMSPALARAIARLSTKPSYRDTPLERLRNAAWDLVEWRGHAASWSPPDWDREASIAAATSQVLSLSAAAQSSDDPKDFLRKALEPVVHLATWIERSEAVAGRDHDALEARLIDLAIELNKKTYQKSGRGRAYGTGWDRDQVKKLRSELIEALKQFRRDADAALAAGLREDLTEVVDRYEALKRKMGRLDFVDLLLKTHELIAGNAAVRGYLQQQFTHLFVDEFQDTDPLQAEILLLLAADDPAAVDPAACRPVAGKLFLVGDPKQSIYRFRSADLLLYQEVRERLCAAGVRLLHLKKSFRSVRPLQVAINAAFEPEMTGDAEAGQPSYVPLEEVATGDGDQPTLIALPVPAPYGDWAPRITGWAIEHSFPAAVASWIAWLVQESGWKVRDLKDPESKVPVRPEHICVLFRRYTSWNKDVTRDYVRGLEARGVPHLLVGERSYHRREEVETMRAALTAIEWPDDELNVFATLKGSLFAIPDAALLRWRLGGPGTLHPMRPRPEELDDDLTPIVEALDVLAELHRRRNRVPVVETVHALLSATRAHAGFALRPAGNQVLANIQRISDRARRYELGGGISFRGFVEQLNAEAEQPTSREAPMPDEGAEGVRIMTVHTAKGLEYPVVVLADPTASLATEEPSRHVDRGRNLCAQRILGCSPVELLQNAPVEKLRDQAEGVRIAYVAATRARDLLVVPAIGDEPYSGWLGPLNKAIYPPRGSWRDAGPAPACPAFGERSVVERHVDAERGAELSVRPGLHGAGAGEHGVVWWDPNVLDLTAASRFGLRTHEILSEAEGARPDRGGGDAYAAWREERDRARRRGARPSFDVVIASDADAAPEAELPAVLHEQTKRTRGRPGGKRFGTLVHTVLRDAALVADTAAIAELALLHGRVLGATGREIEAATTAVVETLAHPLLERARAAERVHRELPVHLDLGDGRIFEGSIDLAFQVGQHWTVIDFKTDHELDERRDEYERQVGWYVHAVQELTGDETRGVLLKV